MDNVFIDIGGVLEVAQSFDSCIEGIRDQQDEMRRLLNTTDPRVLDRHNIRERINNSIKELCWEEDKLRQIQSVLRFAANSYAQAERTIKQQDRDFSNRIDSLVKNVESESGSLLNSIENAFSNAGRFIEDEAQAAEKEFETGAKVLQGEAEAAWNGIADWVGKHKKAIIIAAAAIALIAIGIATCGVGDAAIFAVLGAGAIGAGSGLAGEEISDYMDDGKIDNSDQSYVGSAVGGFITGAICPIGGTEAVGLKGIGLQFAKNGLAGIDGNAASQQISTGKIDFKEALLTGAISGVLTTAAGKIPKIWGAASDGRTAIISESDRLRLSNWKYTPSDDLYIKYKDVYDNPKYYDQTTGKIHWPVDDGFEAGSKVDKVIAEGTIFKRYGKDSGEFLGNATDSFESRALAPHSDGAEVHYYQLMEDYKMGTGKATPWFGSDGGAEQFVKYKSDGSKYTIKELEDADILEDITDLVIKGDVTID